MQLVLAQLQVHCFFPLSSPFCHCVHPMSFLFLHFLVLKCPFGFPLSFLFLCWNIISSKMSIWFFFIFSISLLKHFINISLFQECSLLLVDLFPSFTLSSFLMMAALQSLSDNLNIHVISILGSDDCLFSFQFRSGNIWFYPGFLGVMLQESFSFKKPSTLACLQPVSVQNAHYGSLLWSVCLNVSLVPNSVLFWSACLCATQRPI